VIGKSTHLVCTAIRYAQLLQIVLAVALTRRALCIIAILIAAVPGTRVSFAQGTRPEPVVQLTEAEQAWLRSHPQVVWGFDPDWPPFSSYDADGRLVGIDADITRLVAQRVGLPLLPVEADSWSNVFAEALAGEVDFLSATAKSPERLASFDYTRSYGAFPVVVITRTEAPFLTTMADLAVLKLSAQRGHVTTSQLQEKLPDTRLVLTDTAEDSLKLVASGKADATVQNLAVATRVIRLNGLTNLKIAGVTRYEFPLRFAVRKDEPELASILNKGLATLTADEEERIYAAHLTPDIAQARNWGLWRRWAVHGGAISSIVVGLLLLWNYCLARQIRMRKAAEASLSEARDGLEQRTRELHGRISEVEQLNKSLQVANQDLESFSGSVSHDLRGPLRRVSSFAELLQKETRQSLSGRHLEWMSLMVREAHHMDVIIHDLLKLARIGRGELRRQRVNLEDLVKRTIADFQPLLRNRDVVWKIGRLGEVEGDGNLLHYALGNLIDNALKYTRTCRQAQIRIDALPEPSPALEATLFVQDNGCGFDMSKAKRIFDPFQRLHSEKDYEGIGIGLSNVRRIIQKHGGKIWFDSAPGKGATFYFTLTRCQCRAPSEEISAAV
jgi:signal transduction histidine kinase